MSNELEVTGPPTPKRRHSEIMVDYDQHVLAMDASMKLDEQNRTPSNQLLLSMAALLKETNETLKETNSTLKATKEKVDDLAPIPMKVTILENEVKNLKDSITKLEFSQVANSVICRNLPMHPNAKNKAFEHYLQTETMVNDLLLAAQVRDVVKVVEANRFTTPKRLLGLPETEKPKGPPPVKITFGDKRQVNALFSGLKNLKDTELKNVSINREIPSSLRDRSKLLEKLGSELRKEHEKSRTKIVPKGADLALFIRKNGETKWSIVEED